MIGASWWAVKRYRTGSPHAAFWQATPANPDGEGQNRTLAWRCDGAKLGEGDTILALFNGEPVGRDFTLPRTDPARSPWCRVTDKAAWAQGPDQVAPAARVCVGGEDARCGVGARSLVVLVAR